MITPDQLTEIMPNADADLWIPHLEREFDQRAINSPIRIATFLAHVAVESAEMRHLLENLSYSGARMMQVWPSRFPTNESTLPYEHNPVQLGNLVYANRLGNGPPSSGDGFNYRGRGLLQATGRDHYQRARDALGINLIDHPELLEQPEMAAKEAAWWWQNRGLNAIADAGDFKRSTIVINGALTGYPDRIAYWRRGLQVLEASLPDGPRAGLNQRVQHALNASGAAPPLKEDGIWGPLSQSAADLFRANHGLAEADGVDDALLDALNLPHNGGGASA